MNLLNTSQVTIQPFGPLDSGAEDKLHKQHCPGVLHESDHHPLKGAWTELELTVPSNAKDPVTTQFA